MGVPGMELEPVLKVANAIIVNMRKMVKVLSDNHVLVTIENPRGSVLWHCPPIVKLLQDHGKYVQMCF